MLDFPLLYLCLCGSYSISVLLKVNHIGICLYLLVMTLFMMSVEVRSPLIMESITVPCLKILLKLVKPPSPSSKTNKVGFFVYTTGILDISKQTFADVHVLVLIKNYWKI